MKNQLLRLAFLLLLGVVAHGCAHDRSTLTPDEQKRVRSMLQDRGRWVDPSNEF